jgi:RNA polymerase sigma-B factor
MPSEPLIENQARRVRLLFERYAVGRRQADLDELFDQFQPLARKLAHRYRREGQHGAEDLEQVANLGLIKALKRFDPTRGFAFASFAVPTILGEIKRSFRDTAWAAHVPRAQKERASAIQAARQELETLISGPVVVGDIARHLGIDSEEVLEGLRALGAMSSTSLSAPNPQTPELALGDVLGEADPSYEHTDDLDALATALPVLTDFQRRVLDLRYSQGLKQSEIAARLGVSQMQISRTLSGALSRLRIVIEHQSRPPRQREPSGEIV